MGEHLPFSRDRSRSQKRLGRKAR